MNLRDLRYLVALAEHRHFGRAAEACFVSQPTLSTQIRKIEDELGVTLFERTPRRVLLTPVGVEIARRASEVLNEVEQIRAIARGTRDPESGTVRLGIFPTLGPYLLPHVVPPLRERFPRLELLLTEEKTETLLRLLREGRLDAAIMALPLHDDSLHTQFLFEEPFVLAVPGSHPLAQRRRADAAMLRPQLLVQLEQIRRDVRGGRGPAPRRVVGLTGQFGQGLIPPRRDRPEFLADGGAVRGGLLQARLVGLPALHHLKHDLFQIALAAVQRLDLGLQVLQFARRADHPAVEALAVPVDPGPDLLDVGLRLRLLTRQVAAPGRELGDGVAQLGVPGLKVRDLLVLGKPGPAVLDPSDLGVDVC